MEPLEEILSRCKRGYQELLAASEELLRNFDSCELGGGGELLSRRQEIIDGFQNIDAEIAPRLTGGEGERRMLEEFRAFQVEATRNIMAHDALVIGLANHRLSELKRQMTEFSRHRSAAVAYEGNGGGRRQRGGR